FGVQLGVHFSAELTVQLSRLSRQLHFDLRDDRLLQVEPIFRADREAYIFQQVVDLLVCKVLWLDLARVFIFVEPALLEVGNAVPKPAAEVDEIHLAPQIDVLIWRGRPCQVDPTTDARADRRERLAALRAIAKAKAFEPR